MGPLFSAWKSGGENETDQHDRPLQWGHSFQLGNSGGTSGFWRLPTASMGPRLFRRGNFCSRHSSPPRVAASMGPRLFRRGNFTAEEGNASHSIASMGPRLFRRGNRKAFELFLVAVLLQWGHVFSDVEMPNRPTIVEKTSKASMGPRLFRRGNLLDVPPKGLNLFASMGPRLFRRGNWISARLCRWRQTGFNGATSFQTWKCRGRRPGCRIRPRASMGPRLFRRGNSPYRLSWGLSLEGLQWGHVFSDVEM